MPIVIRVSLSAARRDLLLIPPRLSSVIKTPIWTSEIIARKEHNDSLGHRFTRNASKKFSSRAVCK